jgi:hypothetical protein
MDAQHGFGEARANASTTEWERIADHDEQPSLSTKKLGTPRLNVKLTTTAGHEA